MASPYCVNTIVCSYQRSAGRPWIRTPIHDRWSPGARYPARCAAASARAGSPVTAWRRYSRYNPGYAAAMKTAISIPDDVFEGAERTASALGPSRSELHAAAVREFVERYRSADVTERLDRIYGEDDSLSRLDERLQTLQTYSLGRDDWR